MKYIYIPSGIIFLLLSLSGFTTVTAMKNPELNVPVRVYVLQSDAVQGLNAEISQEQLEDVFADMNKIWKQGGIKFSIKEVVQKKASAESNYLKAAGKNSKMDKIARNRAMIRSCNIKNRDFDALNLCVVSYMATSAGGITFRFKKILPLVVWPINIRDNALTYSPATLAHEFGHALGLPHNSEKEIFLMRGGGNNMRRRGQIDKIRLTKLEVNYARRNAAKMVQ